MLDCQRAGDVSPGPLRLDAAARACLAALTARWAEAVARFRRQVGPPWWAPGLVIDAELRARYEAYLPAAEFLADLCRLGEQVLPHPAWVPARLRRSPTCSLPRRDEPASLPDLWAELPAALAGRVTFSPAELAALYCALADPPRFGTDADRYPVQQQWLERYLGALRGRPLAILDLACGVGLGTLAVAGLAQRAGQHPGGVLGITLEPLDAWMAHHGRLPHDPRRERRLRQLATAAPGVAFLAADVRRLPLCRRFQVVLCNGLVGETFPPDGRDVVALLRECARVLEPGGWLLLANRFHDGCRPAVQKFAGMAQAQGWQVSGDWRDLVLQPAAGRAAGDGAAGLGRTVLT